MGLFKKDFFVYVYHIEEDNFNSLYAQVFQMKNYLASK